jgi:hypothetical protein
MSWKEILKSKGWYSVGTLNEAQLQDYYSRFRMEFLRRLSGDAEEKALWLLDQLELGIKDKDRMGMMTNEYIVSQLNEVLEEAGINPEKESLRGKE